MKKLLQGGGQFKKAKRGYVYITILFIAFFLFVLVSFLLAATNQEGIFSRSKWENFTEDLAVEDLFIEASSPSQLKDLEKNFLERRVQGKEFSKTWRLREMDLTLEVRDWTRNQGFLEGKAKDRVKRGDLYLFHPIFEKEIPYLGPEDWTGELKEKIPQFMENPSLNRGNFIQVGPGQEVVLKEEGEDLVFYQGESPLYRQQKTKSLYLENQGVIEIFGPLSFSGILVNKGEISGSDGLLRGLYFSDKASPLKVRGQVLGAGRAQDVVYDQQEAYKQFQKLPFFFHFRLKNIQSRPHDYF